LALPAGLELESTQGGTVDLAELARNPLMSYFPPVCGGKYDISWSTSTRAQAFYPVLPPDRNAAEVLAFLKSSPGSPDEL
jgi:hypothetical protein